MRQGVGEWKEPKDCKRKGFKGDSVEQVETRVEAESTQLIEEQSDGR